MYSERKDLRNFGYIMTVAFLALGLVPLIKGHAVKYWLIAVALCFLFTALLLPMVLEWPYKVWMQAGHLLGFINTKVLLTVVFFLVVCPIGVLARLFGKDPMRLRSNDESYWVEREQVDVHVLFKRQF